MRKYRFKLIVISASVLLALYLLWPTFRDWQLTNDLKQLRGADSLAWVDKHEEELRQVRAKRIKLGLDLQGGMRVVLEVNVVKLLEDLAKNKDDVFQQVMGAVREQVKRSDEDPVQILRREFESRQVR
ncbi:MAG TPA: protein translocase subunit SecD, partial [Bacteroidota bacterium]